MQRRKRALLSPVLLFVVSILQPATGALSQEKAAPAPDPEVGRKLFESECSVCHGIDGGGGRGPNLRTPRLRHASDEKGRVQILFQVAEFALGSFQFFVTCSS